MATKKSTGRRVPKAKPDDAATVRARYAHLIAPSPALAAPPAPPPDHFEVLNALLDIKGAVRLCQQMAGDDANGGELISDIEGTLTLALCAIERLYGQLDTAALRECWVRLQEEMAHG